MKKLFYKLYYEQELSCRAIGKKMGLSYSGVRNKLIKYGFVLRESSSVMKNRKGISNKDFYGEEKAKQVSFNLSKVHIGVKLSKTHKDNISKSGKGRKHSAETKEKLRLLNIGKKHTDITKLKISKFRKWYANTPKEKNRLREKRKKQILPVKDTSIEIKIQNFLQVLDIFFIPHKYVEIKHGYQCDIFIPFFNLVIECDGNYWHNYPDGNEIDHVRTKEIKEKGYNILRLWESDINKMKVDNFKNKIYNVSDMRHASTI